MPSAVAATVTFLKTVGLAVGGLTISAGQALAIGAATVVAGAVAASKLIAELYKVPNIDSDRSRQATVRGTVEPQKLIYGEALVSGPISFVGVSGTDNRDLYHAIVLAGHPSDSISDIYFDDERIQSAHINASGNVTTGTFGPKDGTTICVIRKLTGSQTTADSVLDGAFSTINSSEHIGTNLTYIVTKFTLTDKSQETWDKFMPNDIKALVKGKKVYDPRQDSTSTYYDANVGVGTQRSNDSTTWEWSENPVWCLVDYLTDDRFGMDIGLDRIDLSKAVDAADICDATVSVPGGSEKRYTCNGVIFGTTTHKTNINKLLSSMNGMLTYTNGKYVIRAGAFEAVGTGMTLTEDHMIGPVRLKTSFERNERFNTITGTFIDPSKNYKEIEFPKVQITSALTRDNNEELTQELKLSMTNSRYMAQRIAHKLIQLSDLQKVLTFPTNLAGVNISVGDRVNVTLSEFGYTNKTFVCLGWTLSESGTGGVNLTLREDDSSSYADLAQSGYSTVTPAGGIQQGFFGVPDPSGLTATAHVESIELDWTNPANMTGIIAIEVFASPNSSWSSAVKIGETIGTQFIHDESNGVDSISEGDQRYYWVRARRFPSGEGSDAVSDRNPDSDTSTVQATKGALGALADQDTVGDGQIDDNAVGTDQIEDGAVGTDQIEDDAVTVDKIANTLESTNYVAGTSGWRLTTAGDFEAGDGDFRGTVKATVLDVEDANVHGTLTATNIAAGIVTADTLAADVFAEFDDRYGGSGGFYRADNDEFFDGSATKYVTLPTVTHDNSKSIRFQCNLVHAWGTTSGYGGTNGLKLRVTFEYSTDDTTYAKVPGSGENSNDYYERSATATIYSVTSAFDLAVDIRYEMTGSSLSDNTAYYFRVKIEYVSATNAFTSAAAGSANGVPIKFNVQQTAGLTASAGDADTVDGLQASQFLRSDTSDTFSGNLTVTGNLTVQGSQTQLDTQTLTVEDNNIVLNYSTGDSSGSADNSGITIQDAVNSSTDASLLWKATGDYFQFSHPINAISSASNAYAAEFRGAPQPQGPSGMVSNGVKITAGSASTDTVLLVQELDNTAILTINGFGQTTFANSVTIDGQSVTGTKIGQWNTAYTYSQVGHLPLAGGTMTGTLNMGANAISSTGTISSGAITSSGIVSGTAFVGGLYAGATGAPDARIWAVSADYPNYGIFYDQGNPDYIDFRWNGVDKLKINMENGLVNSVTGFQVNGTDVINSSRNLVNIGTISSGAITTSGTIKFSSNNHYFQAGTNSVDLKNASNVVLGGFNASGVNTPYGYQISGTTVINSSRNLVNIGTIASGSISTSGTITGSKNQNSGYIHKLTNTNTGTSAYTEFIVESGTQELRIGTAQNYASGQWDGSWVYAAAGDLFLKSGLGHVKIYAGDTVNSKWTFNTDGSIRQGDYNGTTFVDSSRNITAGTISSGAITTTGTVLINDSLGGDSTSAMGNFDRLEFSNSFSDVMRGPNKILMYNSGGWVGGFGIADDLVTYSSGGSHVFYSSQNTTTYDERFRIDDSGDITVNRMIIARSNSGVSAPSNADHTLGTRIKFFDGGSADWYAQGIESSNMWFNTAGGFKWYNDSSIQMTLSADRLGIATTPHASDKLRVGGNISQSAGSIFAFGDLVIGQGALKQGTTTLIDSSRNLTNIGTIASTGEIGVTNGSLTLSSGYNVQWGGAYSSGFPSIFANSTLKVLRFAPSGNTDGVVLEINTGGLDVQVGGYEVGGTTVIASTRRFYASDGTVSKAAYSFDGESSTGMYKYGTNQIGFTAGGSLIAYIQSGATYGLVVQSKISATGGNSDNWNTAYGWGDHSTAGYLTGSPTNLSVSGYLNIGTRIGTVSPGLSITGDSNSSPIIAKAAYDTMSILPWDNVTYIAAGTYYDDGSWVHASSSNESALFGISGNTGGRWYASTNGTGGSWNTASNVQLWNNSGVWVNAVATDSAITSGGLIKGTRSATSAHVDYLQFHMPSWSGHTGYLKSQVWHDGTGNIAAIGAEYDGSKTNIHFHSQYNQGYESPADKTFSVYADGNVNILKDLKINGTTRIAQSGNATLGTISSGRLSPTGIQMSVDTGLYNQNASLSYYAATNAVYLNGAGPSGWLRLNAAGTENDTNAINIFGSNNGANITFKTAGTQRMNIDSGGNLRWGSSNTAILDPSRNLTNIGTISSGAITSSGALTTATGVIMNNGNDKYWVRWSSASTTGLYYRGTGGEKLQFLYGGSERWGVDVSGNMNAYSNITAGGSITGASLIIDGNTAVDKSGNYMVLHDASGSPALYAGNTSDNRNYYQSNHHRFRSDDANTNFAELSSVGLRIGSASSPSEKLHVDGNIRADGAFIVNGTTVIDSSRNLVGIGTINTTGKATIDNAVVADSLHIRGDTNSAYTESNMVGGISLWGSVGQSTSQIMFKPTSAGSPALGNHGFCTDSYNTYFVMDTTNRGWVFRNATTDTNVASISNTGGAAFNNGIKINTTTVIDSSRNLTNIGTISSGQITSSGSVTAGNGSTSLGFYVGTTQVIQGSTRNLVNIGTITAGLTKLTPSGWNAPPTHAALNIGYSGSGETRAIDIDGGWSNGESKSITFTHGSSSTNMVGQINVAHKPSTNTLGSSIRWGKLYHAGDSSTYTMELHSESQTLANLYINTSMVQIGHDATYSNYGVIGFGGRANGNNRVFAHNGTTDGLFLASATGHGIYMRPNGGTVNKLTVAASGQVQIAQGDIILNSDGTYGANYGTIGFGGYGNGYNRIFARNSTADGLYLAAATGAKVKVRANGSGADTLVFGYDDTYSGYASLGFGGAIQNGYNRIFADTGASDGIYITAATGRQISFRVNGQGTDAFKMDSQGRFVVGSTIILDQSRNLTNIGAISCGFIAASGYRIGDDYAIMKFQTPYFTHGTSNLACDFILGNDYINTVLEIEITGGYSNQNTTGLLRRRWYVGLNPNGSIWQTPTVIDETMEGPIVGHLFVSDPFWDSSASTYKIRIYKKNSNGNAYRVLIKYLSNDAADALATNAGMSGLLTSTSTTSSHSAGTNAYSGYRIGGTEIVSSVRRFYASTGTSVKAAYSFDGESNTGWYKPAAGEIAFISQGVERLHVKSTGELEVPTGRVNIDGAAVAFDALLLGSTTQTSYTNVVWYSNSGNAQIWKNGTGSTSWGGASAMNIYNSNGILAFHPQNTANVLQIDSGGPNIGGTKTLRHGGNTVLDASRNLTNITTATISGSTSVLLTLNPTANNYGGIRFQYGGVTKGFSLYNSGAMIYGGESGIPTYLQAGGQYGLAIRASDRNVSIGSVSAFPEKLYVVGNIRADGQYLVSGTTVIDASRNLTNIGTISSGAVTSTRNSGNFIAQTSSDPNNYYAKFEANYSYGQAFRIAARGAGAEHNIMTWADAAGLEFNGGANSIIKFSGDNLSNIGTISSGAITTSANFIMTGGYSIYLGTTSRFSSDNNGGFGINYGTTGGTQTNSLIVYNNTTMAVSLTRGGDVKLTNDLIVNGTTVIDASRNGVFVNLRADGGNLIMGDEAYSASTGYVGMKTSHMSGSNDYMIISGLSDGNTYVSAKDNAAVNIRGGANNSNNQLVVPDSTYISVMTSNLNCTGNVTAYYSSDESLKENIRVIENPIEKIKQIRGVYFDWTDDYIKEQSGDGKIHVRKDDVGVIAQDVQPVLDEVVTTRNDGTLAVRYEKMIALCIEAIKEQQDQIDSLKDIIKEMTDGNN